METAPRAERFEAHLFARLTQPIDHFDETFLQMMIRTLAKAIIAAQDGAISQMTDWLSSWYDRLAELAGRLFQKNGVGDLGSEPSFAFQLDCCDSATEGCGDTRRRRTNGLYLRKDRVPIPEGDRHARTQA